MFYYLSFRGIYKWNKHIQKELKMNKKEIKKAIESWDKKNISSLIEEDVESLTEFIVNRLKRRNK